MKTKHLSLILLAALLPLPSAAEPPKDDTHAVVLLDARLYAATKPLLDEYVKAAAKRRGFGIVVDSVEGLDDLPFEKVREKVRSLRKDHPALEGVLFVGNVQLPSFYSPRGDNFQTRYLPHAYEDLDLVLEKKLKPGDRHVDSTDPKHVVPEHDFDFLDRGPEPGVELWAAFLPVGLADAKANTYEAWAKQLEPFFRKAIAFHTGKTAIPRRLYKVSNQLWNLGPAWAYYGPQRIDFYAVNPRAKGSVKAGTPAEKFCALPPEKAYVRAPMENFPTWEKFQEWYGRHEWMGEGWQKDTILISHLNKTSYDAAWLNVHSCEDFSLVNSAQARAVTKGALVMLLSGCGVGGYRQPGNESFVDTSCAPENNILCAWVYGSSQSLAALGDPFNRGHECYYERMIEWLTKGEYLGLAHRKRLQCHYEGTPPPAELKENLMEMLIGDPFVDIKGR